MAEAETRLATRGDLVAGDPWRWAVELGVGGALIPFSAALPTVWLGWGFVWWALGGLAPFAAACGLGGAVLGWATPYVLQSLRRGVPLWLLVVLAGTLGATVGWVSGGMVGLGPIERVFFTALLGALAGVGWLPYTMAAVLGRSTWPIVAAAVAIAPLATLTVTTIVTTLLP